MKITEIKKYPLSHDGRISLYIEVCTDNGLKGLGEVGVPNMGKTVISAIEHLEKDSLEKILGNLKNYGR